MEIACSSKVQRRFERRHIFVTSTIHTAVPLASGQLCNIESITLAAVPVDFSAISMDIVVTKHDTRFVGVALCVVIA